jgi:cysteine-rich repeat protein
MDALQTSCDTIDDGVLNGSCPECGNGVTEHGEQCDDAGDSATCDANCTFAACGDRYLNAAANEQCDDGNVQNGDCCDSACVFEPDGSPCNDGNICTAPDSCDGAGHCDGPAAPVDPGVCLAATRHGSTLTFKQNGNADKLSWKWKNLDLITNFDDPRAVTYTLCLYKSDGVTAGKLGRVRLQTTSSLWTDLGTRGYKYKDRARGLDGARTAKLKPGNPKKGNIKIKAKGPRYSAPALPLSPNITEIVAQLRYPGGGPCFEARFVPPYNKQTSTSFKDISE